MKKSIIIFVLAAAAALVSACGIYSFSGTSIQPDVKTITIDFFEYKALRVNPSLSNDITEALRTQFRRMTKLEQVDLDGDLEISGEITGYDVKATAVTADEVAAQNRLTITVSVSFQNRKYPDDDFDNRSFSAYEDYDSTLSLDAVESSLCEEIVKKLIDDIFNATVAQW
jgi:outer membrane lipopolysaccharide assembly protein LptE/RlpB